MKAIPWLAGFLLGISASVVSPAQEAKKPEPVAYELGEKVQFHWGGKWLDADIVEIRKDGRARLAFEKDGQTRNLVLPPDKLRKANAADAPAGEIREGDKVVVEQKGNWLAASVVGIKGTGWIEVKYVIDGRELTPAVPPERVRKVGQPGTPDPTVIREKEFRTWTSVDRKTMEARLDEYVGGAPHIVVELRNGQKIQVQLDQLHIKDRAYLTRSLRGMNPKQPGAK